MHNIKFQSGVIESELCEIVNIHKPFHSKVDKFKRKSSLSKLLINPKETLESNQIKRYLVSMTSSSRYAYKLHVTYRNDIKCHNIYDTNSSVDTHLRSSVIKTIIDDVDSYGNLKHDLLAVSRVVLNSYDFDSVITDIPWMENQFKVPVHYNSWNLVEADSGNFQDSLKIILKRYPIIPLDIMPYEVFENLKITSTDIELPVCKCPLILMKSNSFYAGFLAKQFEESLPVTLFKVIGK